MKKKPAASPPYSPPSQWIKSSASETGYRYPDMYEEIWAEGFQSWSQPAADTIEVISTNGLRLRIQIYGNQLLRIRYTSTQFRANASYALAANAQQPASFDQVTESKEHLLLSTPIIRCEISKEDLCLTFRDRDTQAVILQEAAPYLERSSVLQGKNHVRASFKTHPQEVFYGLGDKSWDLNLRGQYFSNWNSDSFAYGKKTDPLYRAIPFYYGLHADQAYGIFFHNTWRTHFDFDSAKDGLTRMWADGGELDYFFIHGPSLDQVARGYHQLTGLPELPPLWVLGFHQCRWSYYPEARVRDLAREFREQNIPCDAIYLDIDYMDGYRCFTWNKEHFPDPGKMIRDLAEEGFQTVVMIDPGIRVDPDYQVYQSGLKEDAFCRRTSGDHMIGPVWPPVCVWPDYTDERVRHWWGQLYQGLYAEDSVSGFWNDMNEPAVFKIEGSTFPDEVHHQLEGRGGNHREAHNVYGQQMSRATYEGLKRIKPDKRPFVLTRASFAGGQRYAAVWTGDNVASWDHLQIANRQCQRLSISGYSLVGTDIGGFSQQPTAELLVRWIQLGVFHPVFRVHSMGNNIDGAAEADAEMVHEAEVNFRLDQEPWVFGEPYTSQAREAIELRYRLLPYLYTSIYQHIQNGSPVIRSLAFEDQTDPKAQLRENEFLCGPHLLVSPVVKAGIKTQSTYLPAGEWFDYFSGRSYKGQKMVRKAVQADTIPLYVRAGGIIPNYPVQQYTRELEIETVTLRVYYGTQPTESELYMDAGEGYEYQEEQYSLTQFITTGGSNYCKITARQTGQYTPSASVFEIWFYGLPFTAKQVLIDDVPVQIIDFAEKAAIVMAPFDFVSVEIRG